MTRQDIALVGVRRASLDLTRALAEMRRSK